MNNYAKEFQQRRTEVWKKCRFWALGVLPLFVLLPFCIFTSIISFPISKAVFVLLGLPAFYSAYRITMLINKCYKCPKCEKVVTESDGIALNPKSCPHCGVSLTHL